MSSIHPTAIIDPKAELDIGVEVGPYSIIGPEVHLGKGCRLDSHVHIKGKAVVAPNNQFFHSCIIGELPQDINFQDTSPHSRVTIGEGNVFREFCQVHRSVTEKGTVVGNQNYFMTLVHLAHDVQVGNHIIMATGSTFGGHASVEDYAFIGGHSAIGQHGRIGTGAIVGGVSGVTQDVPPFVMATGHRAKVYGLNAVGMKRMKLQPETRKMIKQCYKILYHNDNSSVTKAIEKMKSEAVTQCHKDSEALAKVQHFIHFLAASKLGIITGSKSDRDNLEKRYKIKYDA